MVELAGEGVNPVDSDPLCFGGMGLDIVQILG